MKNATGLSAALEALTVRARRLGLTDRAWAELAGLRKETLSRLRSRASCDFRTLDALAGAVGARAGVLPASAPGSTADGHFPAVVGRRYEEELVRLCASRQHDLRAWREAGPAFFMAGLAVMLASVPRFDRRALLTIAEQLHPGASEAVVFNRWLARTPVKPSRLLPLLDAESQHAA